MSRPPTTTHDRGRSPTRKSDNETRAPGSQQDAPDSPPDIAQRRATGPDRASRRWPAYTAAAWALLFAAQSLAAAILATAGSSLGADAFGRDIARMAGERDLGFIVVLWVAVVAKGLGGALALAPTRPWGQRLPGRPLTLVTYAVGALVLLYGVGNLIEHALMKAGASAIPPGLGAHALPWHLWLWDPYWILGGLLFLAAARASSRGQP